MGRGDQDGIDRTRCAPVEAWFVRRGVPQLVAGYSSEQRIDSRAAPWVAIWLVAGTVLWWGVGSDASTGRNALGVLATLLLLGASVAMVRRVQGRVVWWRDHRLETVEVFTLGVAVALASGAVERSVLDGLQDGGAALIGLGAIYATIGLGLGAIALWGLRRLLHEASRIVALLAATLPVLLILVLFLIFAAELWEAVHLLDVGETLAVVALVSVVAATLVFTAVRTELHEMAARPHTDLVALADGTPAAPLAADVLGGARVRLRPLQRLNLFVLAIIAQLIQSAFVAVLVTAFLVVFGLLTLPTALQQRWIGAPPDPVIQLGTLLGDSRVLTVELLTVSVLLGAVVGLYFTGLAVTDTAYRTSHFERVLIEVRVLVAAHALYQAALTPSDPPPPGHTKDG